MTGISGAIPFFTWLNQLFSLIPLELELLVFAIFGIFILVAVIKMFL